jgi:PmbA protein
MNREIVRSEHRAIKLGVIDSAIASVRTQTEEQTAVRVMDGRHIGLASACGRADLDALTSAARESLLFEIACTASPEATRSLSAEHAGPVLDVAGLVSMTESVLDVLRTEYPGFVFSHGVEQQELAWHIESDTGLDLHYRRVTSQIAFIAKEKGSGNIIDTFVGVEGTELDVEGALDEFRTHLTAYLNPVPPLSGRQRVVFPGLDSMAGSGLFQLFRSDLTARTYASGASLFDGRVGDGNAHFNTNFGLHELRDPAQARVCPFDMEGAVRDPLNLDIVAEGKLCSVAASKRDAERYGLPPTGTAIGDVGVLPTSGFGRLGATPTANALQDLLGPDGAILVWFVAGGDSTRTGDIALPVAVALTLDSSGRSVGRLPGCTLTGNLFDVFGDDFVGVTRERTSPFSDEPFIVTHMTVQG